jgi:tetratricopeptide (TPR) repeat protein
MSKSISSNDAVSWRKAERLLRHFSTMEEEAEEREHSSCSFSSTFKPTTTLASERPTPFQFNAIIIVMMSAGVDVPPWQALGGQQVAVCALIYFFVHEEPLNEAGPMLSRLLSYITRLILQVDASSPNLQHFLDLLSTAMKSNDRLEVTDEITEIEARTIKIDALIQESSSFPGLHSFFTKVERLLMTEELYDEIRNVTIKPADRLIDEQSPFGHYIQNCLDHYLGLEDDEFAFVVRSVHKWVAGEEAPADAMGETGESSDHAVASALRKGDYSLARAELEGFFDRSPLDWTTQSLQDTLFKNATFHYQTKAYESARSSLGEALRLSRGVNDLACISACDALLQRIDDEEDGEDWTPSSKTPLGTPRFTLQNLWQVQREVDRGRPLLPVLSSLGDLLRQSSTKATASEPEQVISSEEFAECCLSQARVWREAGIGSSASAFLDSSIDESARLNSTLSAKLQLPIASLQSEALTESGKINEALAIFFAPSLLQSLGMTSFTDWQAKVWKILYTSALQDGAVSTMRAIEAMRPEVVKEVEGKVEKVWSRDEPMEEPNEASFGRSDKITLSQQLHGHLKEARILREDGNESATSLTMVSQVMRKAEDSNLFCLYRRATMECCESLLALGNASRAKEVLEDVMPQLLVERNADLRGKAAWLYARTILSLQGRQREDEDLRPVLPWLARARKAFTESGTLKELSDVLYVEGRLFSHLGMKQEEQESQRSFDAVMHEYNEGNSARTSQLFETIQSMVMLAGAQIVAGA